MAEYLLLLLLQTTLFSTTTALCLFVIRCVFHCRIPPKLGMAMWFVLLLRVVCPVFPESQLSIYNLIPAGREVMFTLTYEELSDFGEAQEGIEEKGAGLPTAENFYAEFERAEAERYGEIKELPQEENIYRFSISEMILILYSLGAIATTGIHCFLYGRAVYRLKKNISLNFDNQLERMYRDIAKKLHIRRVPELYRGERSLIVGYVKPIIVLGLDKDASSKEYEMVLTHELNHYKHLDNQILFLSTAMCCLFWYNPMIWIVRKLLREDIELLCDMRTISASEVESAEYAQLLCRYSQFGNMPAAVGTPMSASGRRLKKRLLTISFHKKNRFLSKTTSVLLSAAIVMVCLTNPIISKEHEYQAYIESIAELTGMNAQDIYLAEHTSVYEFLNQIEQTLLAVGDEALAAKVGSGSLEKLKRIAAASPYVSKELAEEVAHLQAAEILRNSSCVVLLDCITSILSGNQEPETPQLLPVMISVETFDKICAKLSSEQAAKLKACYNLGNYGVDISFNYLYSNAMMEQIMSRINDDWSKEKLLGYYTEINLLPEQLDGLSDYLNEEIRYMGVGTEYYICVPNICKNEEEVLRKILDAAVAGQKEDVYYLKKTEDGCSYETAENLFRIAGFTLTDMCEEYARIGGTTYSYITPENYTMISEYDVREYAERLGDDLLTTVFNQYFVYHENYVYEDEDSMELTVPFRYYTTDEDNREMCDAIMKYMLNRLNAVTFTYVTEVENLSMTGNSSEIVRDSAIKCIEKGFISVENETIDMREEVSSGQCAMILCRFIASMTNLNK